MTYKTCESCKWFLSLARECHYNPPSVLIMPGPDGRPVFLGVFPPTKAGNHCSKHETDLSQTS